MVGVHILVSCTENMLANNNPTDGNRTITDWRTCNDNIGVKVKPRQGDAVLFWSTRPDLQLDDHALHGELAGTG